MRFSFALTVLAATFASVAAATVSDCKKDVSDIAHYVQFLDKAVEDLPKDGISISQGIVIHTGVINLQRAFDKASVDFKATPPFSSTDSQAILTLVESYSPSFLHLLANIVAKKESIVSMSIPGINIAGQVRGALDRLRRSNDAFDDVWISLSTNDVKNQARPIKANIDTAFAKADAAYSSRDL